MTTLARCGKCGAICEGLLAPGLCPACLMALAGEPDLPGDPTHASPPDAPIASYGQPVLGADPEYIGSYRILERIGEGGMGVVFRAEQRQPIYRVVAVKVVKLGMSTRDVVARFEAERQALALMNHPNVAKVFEAGATEDGRPYFVMEYVHGEPINAYCDNHRLPVPKRLELFVQACEAVQHAHQKAIIHRDIKPTNLLVTLEEIGPVLKVIDFGVAKALSQPLTQRTLFTEQGRLIGTPEYMSPEQADMGGVDLDTRTDIYSLGVVLYELLIGALPFDSATLRTVALDELRRVIREQEPPRPSHRLTTLGEVGMQAAGRRATDSPSLQRTLLHELEWIPLKAMRKDRNERYRSAAELADDIRNYIAGRPLIAGPQSTSYRLRKLLRKHRRAVSLATAIVLTFLALVVALAVEMRQAIRSRNALSEKSIEYRQAALRAEQAERMANQRLARKLVAFGDNQLAAGQSAEALQSYMQSLSMAQGLGLSKASLMARLFASADLGRPLMGHFGRDQGIGGFAGGAHVNCLALLPDGNTAVTAEADKTLKLWDLRTGRHLHTFRGHGESVNYVSISPDGDSMLSASNDGTVRVWDLASRSERAAFTKHSGHVFVANFSPDGRLALSGDEHGNLLLWDVTKREVIQQFYGHTGDITAAVFSPDGHRALSAGDHGIIRLWDLVHFKLIGSYGGHDGHVNDVAFSPDGSHAVSGGFDKTVRLWDLSNPNDPGLVLGTHQDWVWRVAFLPDGSRVASASRDQTVRLWKISTPGEYDSFGGQTGESLGLAFSKDGRMLAVSGDDSVVRVWDVPAPLLLASAAELAKYAGATDCAVCDEGLVALATRGGAILIYDAATRQKLRTLTGHGAVVKAVSFSADGHTLLSGAADGTISVWNLSSGQERSRAAAHAGPVAAVAFVGDTTVVSAGSDQTIKIWDVAATSPPAMLCDKAGPITCLGVWADGRTLVCGTSDGSVMLCGISDRKRLWQARASRGRDGKPSAVSSVALAPDGSRVLVAGPSGVSSLDPTSGNATATAWTGSARITRLAFLPDSAAAWSAGEDGTLKLWSAANGTLLQSLRMGVGPISLLALSPDGSRAVYVGADGGAAVIDFAGTAAGLDFVSRAAEARAALDRDPANAAALATLGTWFSLHERDEWAVGLLEEARRNTNDVSSLTLARCYWRLGRLGDGAREFRRAIQKKAASSFYLTLCLDAVSQSAASASHHAGKTTTAASGH